MKQKTHSGAKKRVKITGRNKVVLNKSCKNHLMSSKSPRQLAVSRSGVMAPTGHLKKLSRMLNMSRKIA